MNKQGNIGISSILVLLTVFLIASTAASVLIGGIVNTNDSDSKNDLMKITQEAVDEITTYLQVKDVIGKYSSLENEQRIQSIAVLIKPLISSNIDLSTLTIEISNGYNLRFFSFSGQIKTINSSSLFEHPLWETLSSEHFSILVVLDTDNSIRNYNAMNAQTDTTFLLLKLPDDLTMKKDDSVKITLLPATGVTRTITVTAPLPMRSIVSLLE